MTHQQPVARVSKEATLNGYQGLRLANTLASCGHAEPSPLLKILDHRVNEKVFNALAQGTSTSRCNAMAEVSITIT